MVSEFRKKKYLYLLDFFFDFDKNETIEKRDIDFLIENATGLRGWKPGDDNYKEFEKNWLEIWNGLLSHFDTDKDSTITAEEWITSWDKYSKNGSDIAEWQKHFQNAVFEFLDHSKDGKLDCNEFITVFSSTGVEEDEVKQAFQRASKGNPEISRTDFNELWKEFYSTEDPDAPGNFIFGKVNF